MNLRDLTILNELAAFREQMAAQLDRPTFKVLSDERLILIAKAQPSGMDDLKEVGLTSRQMQYWGGPILSAVKRGMKGPLVQRIPPQRPDDAYIKRLDKLKKWRKKAAEEMDVESDVVLPRPLLLALAGRGPEDLTKIMQCSPWRLARFGSQILKVLGG